MGPARLGGAIAALALVLVATACSKPCEEFCTKASDCLSNVSNGTSECDSTQCTKFCEQALDNGAFGIGDRVECALDQSCDDLAAGACFDVAVQAVDWCL